MHGAATVYKGRIYVGGTSLFFFENRAVTNAFRWSAQPRVYKPDNRSLRSGVRLMVKCCDPSDPSLRSRTDYTDY